MCSRERASPAVRDEPSRPQRLATCVCMGIVFAANEAARFESDELSANGSSYECSVGNLDQVDFVLTALPLDE